MKDRKQRSNHPHNSRVDTHSYKNRHIWVWVISIVALLAVAGAAYFASVYFRTKSAVDRTEKRGRTDTMILAVVNPAKKRYTLVSIPRDTMAQMVGSESFKTEKINAAYELGGARMSMDSVSKLINVPIKYYAVVNMGGIMKMIRYVGGINIRPTLSFEYGGYIFKKGKLTHMGGAGALAYSRMRYDDPRGNVRTNLPCSAMQQIAMNYRSCANSSSSDYLHGYNAMIDDAAYQVQPNSELQRISNLVRKELGLPKEMISNNETFQNEKNIANGFSFKSEKTQHYHIYDYTEEGDN